jgi:6-phosphogluconolactonase
MVEPELHVLDDPAAAVAELLAAAARTGGTIGLTGGQTIGHAYEHAAALQPDWSRVEVWWGDERCVPPDDERSNFLLARQTLLDRLERPPEVHRIRGELEPEEAAAEYDAALADVALDLAVMGIGPDGHTASLFPDAPALNEAERRAVAAEAGMEPFVPRVTMTVPALAAARTMVYLVTGEAKAEAVGRAFSGEPSPATPASLVRGVETIALLDRAAAARL